MRSGLAGNRGFALVVGDGEREILRDDGMHRSEERSRNDVTIATSHGRYPRALCRGCR